MQDGINYASILLGLRQKHIADNFMLSIQSVDYFSDAYDMKLTHFLSNNYETLKIKIAEITKEKIKELIGGKFITSIIIDIYEQSENLTVFCVRLPEFKNIVMKFYFETGLFR